VPENSGLQKTSKVHTKQVRTISKQRISGNRIGTLDEATMGLVDAALKLHLNL
jgi:mRNA interferase MazF